MPPPWSQTPTFPLLLLVPPVPVTDTKPLVPPCTKPVVPTNTPPCEFPLSPPRPVSVKAPVPVTCTVAWITRMPLKLPLVVPAAFALNVRLPSTVVTLPPVITEMSRAAVSEIAPVPVAKRSELEAERLMPAAVPVAVTVRFLFTAIVTD